MDGYTPCRWDVWRGWVLCATVTLCPVAYSFDLTSFLVAKELVLAVGVGLMAGLVLLRGRWTFAGVWAFLPLWMLVLGSCLVHVGFGVARVPSYAVVELNRVLLLLMAIALGFDLLGQARWRRRVQSAVVLSATPVAVLGLLQYAGLIPFLFPVFPGYSQRAYSAFGNQDLLGTYLAVCLVLSTSTLLISRRLHLLAVIAAPLLLAGVLVSGSRAAWLASLIGALLLVFTARRRPKRIVHVSCIAAVVTLGVVACAPEATWGRISTSLTDQDIGFRVRGWIWEGAAKMFAQHPVVGVGPGNFAYWSPQYLGRTEEASAYRNELHAVHAESEPLEIAAETGLAGLLLCAWMLVRVMRRRGLEWIPLVSLIAASMAGFPLRSAPHALAGLLLAGMLLARSLRAVHYGRRAVGLAVPAFPLIALFVWSSFVPSALLGAAENDRRAGIRSLDAYQRAANWSWPSPEAQARYGFVLAEAGDSMEARMELVRALEGLDTGDLYLGLGALAVEAREYPVAQRWLRECLLRWPDNATARELYEHCERVLAKAEPSR